MILEVNFEGAAAATLETARLSPNENYLAIGGAINDSSGYLIIMSLESKQVIFEKTFSERICHIDWINHSKIIFIQFSSQCDTSFLTPTSIDILDITTPSLENISNRLLEMQWLLGDPY
ncbi:hypothetical protein G4Y79_05575 [Phototrophicus methaneseepsis]|uniref:Uncharacterized protein n=1 Tax=Phototrophicus methaneseepsis TaxID=2710758 RepID=A0A7S8IEM7_9CHLR|nr:hypothetical protein [Phototrophicus methaneseepsis]QPC83850.1 hypothetical protein G4Y79_05575 [Phototrophicus methaneseepsis]